MEMHHRLRRDPSWDPRGCNICGQLGHQAAMCPNGTIDWREIYGDDVFVMKRPIFESELRELRKKKHVDITDLERRAKEYAKARADAVGGINYDDMSARAQAMFTGVAGISMQDPAAAAAAAQANGAAAPAATAAAPAAAPAATAELPPGWGTANDPSTGKPYYYHKKTQKVTWERPTADTPIE